MNIFWRSGQAQALAHNGNKYFGGYEVCATGIRNFVAAVGIPFYSFDACFSKHLYYKGVYGNFVTLVDTKPESFTNIPMAVTTAESEIEPLYTGLFDVSGCNNPDSELLKRMKEPISCVIGDGSQQFLNAARTALGQKPIATCSFHVKENARKKGKQGFNEPRFWKFQQARSRMERDAAWATIERTFSPAALNYLRREIDDDLSAHGRPWTKFAQMQRGICTFGRKGANNPVEQLQAKQVPGRHHEPDGFLLCWVESVRDKENVILAAAEKLEGKTLTPWAERTFESNSDYMRTCRIGNGDVVPVIYPDADVEVLEPHENGDQRESRHHVNLNARTCTCTNWHFNGIACCHALKVWDVYQSQRNDIPVAELGPRMRKWAVNSKPWFLAAKFREAAEVLKTERIKLPADANLEVDDKLFPPPCLAKLNHGRNVQEVAAAPPGRPRRRRIIPNRRCGNCNQPGHTKSKCNRHIPWFDWSNPEHLLFQEAYTRSIPRAVRVDFRAFISFNFVLQPTQNGQKTRKTDDASIRIFNKKSIQRVQKSSLSSLVRF